MDKKVYAELLKHSNRLEVAISNMARAIKATRGVGPGSVVVFKALNALVDERARVDACLEAEHPMRSADWHDVMDEVKLDIAELYA